MVRSTDEAWAQQILLSPSDLPGESWQPGSITPLHSHFGRVAGDPEWFPESAVTASASSGGFTRHAALAHSMAWVLATATEAEDACAFLTDTAFVSRFLGRTVGSDAQQMLDEAMLGHQPEPAQPITGSAHHGAHHRSRVVVGDGDGVVDIHVEMVVLHRERALTVLILIDSPDPWAPGDASSTVERVAARLAPHS